MSLSFCLVMYLISLFLYFFLLFLLVLTQMLTDEDHSVTKESVQKFVALVDTDPSTEDLDTLFPEVRRGRGGEEREGGGGKEREGWMDGGRGREGGNSEWKRGKE